MRITRNFPFHELFYSKPKEFLYVWDTTKDKEGKAFLAKNIRKLWIYNSVFKAWAGNVHARNEKRAHLLKKARIRLSVVMQNGATVGVCVSPLVTGKEVCWAALKKRKAVTKRFAGRKGEKMCLTFEGGIIDGRRTMLDAGISDRSTVVVTFDALHVNRATRPGLPRELLV